MNDCGGLGTFSCAGVAVAAFCAIACLSVDAQAGANRNDTRGSGSDGGIAGIEDPAINIEFRPAFQSISVGETAMVGLYLVGTPTDQLFSSVEAVFEWDNSALQLQGLSSVGAIPLLTSGFPPNHPGGYNETIPPQDGDGIFLALAQLGVQTPATPAGTLITTFLFTGLTPGTITVVEPVRAGGDTRVVSGSVPGLIVTGTLMGALVEVVCSGVFADLNCDGIVDGADLGLLLAAWGSDDALADLNNDGVVGGADLGLLLAAWSG